MKEVYESSFPLYTSNCREGGSKTVLESTSKEMAFAACFGKRSDAPSDERQHVPDDLTLFNLASKYGNPLFLSFFQKMSGISVEIVASTQNAFSIMMVSVSALHWPAEDTWQDINRKLDLKADFLQWMKRKNFGWHAGIVESHGVPFIQTMIGVYWLLIGQRLMYRPNISYIDCTCFGSGVAWSMHGNKGKK